MDLTITVDGDISGGPRACVQVVEKFAKIICQKAELDPADTTMVILTVAARLAVKYSKAEDSDLNLVLAEALEEAISIAREWLPDEEVDTM